MLFQFYVFVWKDECSDWRTFPADVSMPIEVGVPVGRTPSFELLVQDVLILSDLSFAKLVRFVDATGGERDFWNVIVEVSARS